MVQINAEVCFNKWVQNKNKINFQGPPSTLLKEFPIDDYLQQTYKSLELKTLNYVQKIWKLTL